MGVLYSELSQYLSITRSKIVLVEEVLSVYVCVSGTCTVVALRNVGIIMFDMRYEVTLRKKCVIFR
jgi:hypothetical protein